MNVAQAKQLDLTALLSRLGYQEQPVTRQGVWYFSPFREEDTPSFKVWQLPSGLWCWKDFGSGEGGNIIAFANRMIGKETDDRAISEALKWLDGINGVGVAQAPKQRTQAPKSSRIDAIKPERFTLIDNKRLRSPQLLGYLAQRGIPQLLAQAHCGQAQYLDSLAKKKFFGISFPNIEGGLEIRAATDYKHHVNTGTKAISFIPGQDKDAPAVHVFEGFTDFLSWLVLIGQEKPDQSAIVLNSTAFAGQAAEYIKSNPRLSGKVKTVVTYFDHDESAQKAFDRMADILISSGYSLGDCSYIYDGFHDLNEYLTQTPASQRIALKAAPAKFFDTSATVEARRAADRLRETLRNPKPN